MPALDIGRHLFVWEFNSFVIRNCINQNGSMQNMQFPVVGTVIGI